MNRTFDWLGIRFDEGQNIGGAFGPYIQVRWMDRWMDKWMNDGWMDGWING